MWGEKVSFLNETELLVEKTILHKTGMRRNKYPVGDIGTLHECGQNRRQNRRSTWMRIPCGEIGTLSDWVLDMWEICNLHKRYLAVRKIINNRKLTWVWQSCGENTYLIWVRLQCKTGNVIEHNNETKESMELSWIRLGCKGEGGWMRWDLVKKGESIINVSCLY